MVSTVYVGIDNGLSGALVYLDGAGRLLAVYDAPTVHTAKRGTRRDYMVAEMARLLRDAPGKLGLVTLEKAQAMPGQGVRSTGTTMRGAGLWEGICAGLGLPYQVVHPRTWQRVMLRDVPGTDTKARSVLQASRLWPDLSLVRKKDHNRADAALLAEYGRRIALGQGGG